MVHIGTSGWTYPDWRGPFYPDRLPQRKWLEFYSSQFDAVEINSTFYRIPTPIVARGWLERTPVDFRFVPKLSRLITHVRLIVDCAREVGWFFAALEPLLPKIGGYLVQFPPSLEVDPVSLEHFLDLLPTGRRYFLEYRNNACSSEAILALMRARRVSLCIHDYPGRSTPPIVTADAVYLRLHGYRKLYAGSYPDVVLEGWAERIGLWRDEGRDVFVFFNNDVGGAAIDDARRLRKMVQGG